MSKLKDLTAMRFGRLVVIERATNCTHHTRWLCKCDCGNETLSHTTSLINGNSKSCGCLNKENLLKALTTHNGRYSKLYKIWSNVKARCCNKNHEHYKYYGGRGIKVCEEWLQDFGEFRKWAANSGYSDGLTIERNDVNGDYSPNNCSWIPANEQTRNRRNTVYVNYKDAKMRLKEVADILGVGYKYLHKKYKAGTLETYAVGVTYLDTQRNIWLCEEARKKRELEKVE